ncbi:MAG TPA: hypothetical protein P5160_03830 [Candidatus Omnitrophota bacterium]|nr:hypothetical protein [Candidatus Omnitrophota bacterium]
MAKETAEQKLLKLIEATNAEHSSDASKSAPVPSTAEAQRIFDSVRGVGGGSALAAPQVFQSLQSIFQNFSSGKINFKSLGLKEANVAMAMVIIFIALGFALSLTQNIKASQKPLEFADLKPAPFSSQSIVPVFTEIAEYVAAVSARNIFQPFEEKKIVKEEAVPAEILGIQKVIDRTKDLKLVGISWLDTADSASAMVENTGSGVTYFLRPGDKINEVLVTSIYADSIVVEFQGEQLEIKL